MVTPWVVGVGTGLGLGWGGGHARAHTHTHTDQGQGSSSWKTCPCPLICSLFLFPLFSPHLQLNVSPLLGGYTPGLLPPISDYTPTHIYTHIQAHYKGFHVPLLQYQPSPDCNNPSVPSSLISTVIFTLVSHGYKSLSHTCKMIRALKGRLVTLDFFLYLLFTFSKQGENGIRIKADETACCMTKLWKKYSKHWRVH